MDFATLLIAASEGAVIMSRAQGTFIQATVAQVALPELAGLSRSLLAWLTTAGTAGLDEDGIVALFASVLRDFRERSGSSGNRRGAHCHKTEGVA